MSEFEIRALDYLIRRDAGGNWTLTPPASTYGWKSVEEMILNGETPPKPEPLADACFAHAPFVSEIIIALCNIIEEERIELSWD